MYILLSAILLAAEPPAEPKTVPPTLKTVPVKEAAALRPPIPFATLAKMANAANPPGTAGYSITGKPDARAIAATRMFDLFERYAGPVNVQYPRCYTGRACQQFYQSLQNWDRRRQTEVKQDALTAAEWKAFKAACYTLVKSPYTPGKGMQYLVITADHDDLQPMLTMLTRYGPTG